MSEENGDIIFEKYSIYIDILIKERKDLGDALQEILYEPDIFQEDAEGKRMSAIERRVKELDSQIEGILFPNVFKKKLIIEKE